MTSPVTEYRPPVTLLSPVAAWEGMTGRAPGPARVTLLEPVSLGPKRVKLYAFKLDGLPTQGPVISLRCRVGRAMSERRLFSEVLPAIGVPAPESYGWTPDPEDGMAWHFLEFLDQWGSASGQSLDEWVLADWLGLLHSRGGHVTSGGLAARDADHYRALVGRVMADLEARVDPVRAVRGLLDSTVVGPLLAQLGAIAEKWPTVAHELSAMPHSLVHGDLKPGNVGVRMTGGKAVVVPFDWEYAGRGPIAVDLWVPGVRRNPEAYLARVNATWRLSRAELDRMVAVGGLLRAIDAIGWVARDPADRAQRHLQYWGGRLEATKGIW